MNEDKKILSIRNLVVEYAGDKSIVQAVNDVSLQLSYGKTLALVGETGAGKTTIAKSILRVLQEPPARIQAGEIWLDDKNLLTFNNEEMRKIRGKRISMIFQDPMTALNPVMRIGRQIAEGIRLHEGLSWKEANIRAEKMLELVGISSDRFREYPHQFSGGMKQRVVIAAALACNPDLLIADEPTSALDVTIQAQVLELIRRLQQENNSSMILITHDFGIVAENCDDIAVIYAGQVVEYGTKEQVFIHHMHPYTEGLFAAIPDMENEVEQLKPITGAPPDPTNLPEGCYFAPRCPYATGECKKRKIPVYQMEDGHQIRCLRFHGKAEAIE